MTKRLLILLIALSPIAAFAAGGAAAGHHGPTGVPVQVVYQAINFLIFAGILFFFLRKPVANYFSARQDNYKAALVRAEAARKEAEAKRRDIQERLNKLESTSEKAIADAKAEAAALRTRIVKDAEDLAKNLREEASRTAGAEVERAKVQLREEVLGQAVALSRKLLEEKVTEPDQKRLQSEFVDKIQAVR